MRGRKRKVIYSHRWSLMVIVVAIVVGLVVYWVGFRQRRWLGGERFTVVELGPPVVILSFDPQARRGVRLVLPDNLEIETVGGRGVWQAGVLEKLVAKFGRRWAADSVADYLGIAYTDERQLLSSWDRVRWWRLVAGNTWDDVMLQQTGALEETRTIDGEKVARLGVGWGEWVQDWFVSAAVAREGLRVTMVNSTEALGMGGHAARQIETMGMKVEMVESSERSVRGCEVRTNKVNRVKLGVRWLARSFGCKWVDDEERGEGVRLVLGSDYLKWWKG